MKYLKIYAEEALKHKKFLDTRTFIKNRGSYEHIIV